MQGPCLRKANSRVCEERGWHAGTGKGCTRTWCGCVSQTVSETLNRMIHFQHWTPKETWTKLESLLEIGGSWESNGERQLWRRGEVEESMAGLGLRAQVFGHRLLHYRGCVEPKSILAEHYHGSLRTKLLPGIWALGKTEEESSQPPQAEPGDRCSEVCGVGALPGHIWRPSCLLGWKHRSLQGEMGDDENGTGTHIPL